MHSILQIQDLQKSYVAGKPILHHVNLNIGGESITSIIGPSGAGKSTLIRCINRLIEPTDGKVMFLNQDITHVTGKALRRARSKIGMIFQEYNLVERLTVMENVLSGRLGVLPVWRAWFRKFPQEDIQRAFELLDKVGLKDKAYDRADNLSGGQRQRVGIARALMQRPKLILADEPTSSLDPKTSVEVMQMLVELAGENKTPVIINIHDVSLAKRFSDRIVGMRAGKLIFDGPPETLQDSDLKFIYGGESWLN